MFDDFQLLAGIEVDILPDGSLDFDDDILEEMDVVIASIHSGFKQDRDTLTSRIITAIRNEHVDIIGHPSGRLLGRRGPYQIDMERVLDAAAETGTALEINASPDRLDLNDRYIRLGKERGYGFPSIRMPMAGTAWRICAMGCSLLDVDGRKRKI